MANNIQTVLDNPKSRNGIIILGVFTVVAIGGGLVLLNYSNKENKATGSSKVSGPKSNLNVTPGGSDSAEYISKLEIANREKAEKALESGKTSTGILTGGSNLSDNSPLDMLADNKQITEPKLKEEVEITPQDAIVLPTISVASAPPSTTEIYTPAPLPKFGTTEDYYILEMASSVWAAKQSNSEYNYNGIGKPLEAQERENANIESQRSQNAERTSGQVVSRVGDIMNAVLETGINSDEPGPVLATIVSGKFKGSRLTGSAKRRNEKMIVEFTAIAIPGRQMSDSISAVAIDMNSIDQASTLASSVDNHYFKKYGLLFAASLLGAYSDVVREQNTTQIITPEGGVITTQNGDKKTSKEINRQAIGAVGKSMTGTISNESSQVIPTVKVNRGAAIGILLMSDLRLRS